MSNLRAQLEAISQSFADKLLAAIASESVASVGELRTAIGDALDRAVERAVSAQRSTARVAKPAAKPVAKPLAKPVAAAPAPARAAKPPSRPAPKSKGRAAGGSSKFRVAVAKDQVLSYVKAHPNERSEKIRAALKLERPLYQRAVKELTADKKIASKGEKRTTTLAPRG